MAALHLRGIGLPDAEPIELWIVDGLISFDPVSGAETIVESGWITPGLVDAHCHVGIRYGGGGGETVDGLLGQAKTERDAGVLLLRDAGSPVDTRFIDERLDLPRIIRAGQHIAAPKRYIPGLPVDLDDESQLPAEVVRQARAGDGWVKLVGDWIDRSIGDLAPLWSDEILVEAIAAAHAEGARVTAHVFAEDALPGLINAGIDCIEHGTGLTDATIELMVAHGTALVPTLINIATFPEIADSATRYPDLRGAHAGSARSSTSDDRCRSRGRDSDLCRNGCRRIDQARADRRRDRRTRSCRFDGASGAGRSLLGRAELAGCAGDRRRSARRPGGLFRRSARKPRCAREADACDPPRNPREWLGSPRTLEARTGWFPNEPTHLAQWTIVRRNRLRTAATVTG